MPMTTARQVTYTGLPAGSVITTPTHDEVFGTGAAPVVVDVAGDRMMSVAHLAAGAGTSLVADVAPVADTAFASVTFDVMFTAAPSAAGVISELRNASAKMANVLVNVAGGLPTLLVRAYSAGQTTTETGATGWTTAVTLQLNTRYRVSYAVRAGSTTSNGGLLSQLVRVSDGAVLAQGSSSDKNTGVANPTRHQSGKNNSGGTMPAYFDAWAFSNAAYALLPAGVDVVGPEPIPEESPAGTKREHTYLGRVPGATIDVDEHSTVSGDPTVRRYALDAAGNVVGRFAGAAGINGFVGDAVTSTRKLSVAFEVILNEAPSANCEVFNTRTADANTGISIVITTDRRLIVRNGAGTQVVMSSPPMDLGTRYAVQAAVEIGTTTTNGRLRGRFSQTIDTEIIRGESLAAENLTDLLASYRYGKVTTTPSLNLDIDNFRSYDGFYGWTTPAADAPNAGPDLVADPWWTVELNGLGPGSWVQTSGPAVQLDGTGSTRSFYAAPSTVDVVRTFTFGGDPMKVTVLRAPDRLKQSGTWRSFRRRTLESVRRNGLLPGVAGQPAMPTSFEGAGQPGVPAGLPTWAAPFNVRSIATTPTDTSAAWMPVDPSWQLRPDGSLNPGYVDPAAPATWLEQGQIAIANGVATFTAQRTPDARKADIQAAMLAQGIPNPVAPAWLGGILISNPNRRTFPYGYFAARLRIPTPTDGKTLKGAFPAFWLYSTQGSNDPLRGEAEIDVLEVFGHPSGSPYTVTQHYGKGDHTVDRPPVTVATVAQETAQWHVYGVDFQPFDGFIRYYRDGVLVGERTGSDARWFAGASMGIRLNLSMDAPWFGANLSDATTTPTPRMEVDWAAVWPRR